MQKSFLFSFLSAAILFSTLAGAESPGRYVRKQLKPNFFIPPKEPVSYTHLTLPTIA